MFFVSVQDDLRASVAKYALYVERLREPVSGQPLAAGKAVRGVIDASLQPNVYTFDAAAGEQVFLDVFETPTLGPLILRVIIFTPDGKEEYEGVAHDGVGAEFAALGAGTHVVFVNDPRGNVQGAYTVLRK
jgi:hypothetical protein